MMGELHQTEVRAAIQRQVEAKQATGICPRCSDPRITGHARGAVDTAGNDP
jgi:hypothetical protein